jgi:hypothetical protein
MERSLQAMCRRVVEDALDLYEPDLLNDSPTVRFRAIDLVSSFRERAGEAEAALHTAGATATSEDLRDELLSAIDDLHEWNSEA